MVVWRMLVLGKKRSHTLKGDSQKLTMSQTNRQRTTICDSYTKIFLISFPRIGYPCPVNYNPADYFVQILAFIPEKEEESKERIKVCL